MALVQGTGTGGGTPAQKRPKYEYPSDFKVEVKSFEDELNVEKRIRRSRIRYDQMQDEISSTGLKSRKAPKALPTSDIGKMLRKFGVNVWSADPKRKPDFRAARPVLNGLRRVPKSLRKGVEIEVVLADEITDHPELAYLKNTVATGHAARFFYREAAGVAQPGKIWVVVPRAGAAHTTIHEYGHASADPAWKTLKAIGRIRERGAKGSPTVGSRTTVEQASESGAWMSAWRSVHPLGSAKESFAEDFANYYFSQKTRDRLPQTVRDFFDSYFGAVD